jgi:acetoin utilization protein AcuB
MLRHVVIKDAMSDGVQTTGPDVPLAEAARVMIERKSGCLPVVEDENLVGILSETDVVRLVAEGKLGST